MKDQHTDESRPDRVLAHLRKMILRGELKAGERLIEQDIATTMHTSRGPVRDALRQLEQEGLIQIFRNRGAVVSRLGPREAYEFYLVRGHLEGLAVRLARENITANDIDYLAELVGEMGRLGLNDSDWLPAIELDLAFHRRIVEASQNRSLIQLYTSMDTKVGALFMAVKQLPTRTPTRMASLHQPIVDVFRLGDWWRAETVVTDHWHETAADFRQVYLRTLQEEKESSHDPA